MTERLIIALTPGQRDIVVEAVQMYIHIYVCLALGTRPHPIENFKNDGSQIRDDYKALLGTLKGLTSSLTVTL